MRITPAQAKAAMALVGLKQKQLAFLMGHKSRGPASDFLRGDPRVDRPLLNARIRQVIESQGVQFIPGGVRLASRQELAA